LSWAFLNQFGPTERINIMEEKTQEQLDADISLEFLEEYKKLVKKYKRDFQQFPGELRLTKVEFPDEAK